MGVQVPPRTLTSYDEATGHQQPRGQGHRDEHRQAVWSGPSWRKKRAAKSSGHTLTEFTVEALTERAEEVLAQRPLFVADAEQWAEFMRILDEPARPVPELVELFRRPTVFEE